MPRFPQSLFVLSCLLVSAPFVYAQAPSRGSLRVRENEERVTIETDFLSASIRKSGYVSGVEAQSFVDKKTGFRDAGFGLDIVDWLCEPGSDTAYRDQLPEHLIYTFNDKVHGMRPKRIVEGPQICTRAQTLSPESTIYTDGVLTRQSYAYREAPPGRSAGSRWTQTLFFPKDKRFFISMDVIEVAQDSDCLFLRIDMPGHIKHVSGDSFSEIYLSYHGVIPASEFKDDFAPDEKFHFAREINGVPERMIRAYHLRDPKTGKDGPWLAGMTLAPDMVYEAWCHQRGYVCMIEEIGGLPVKKGDKISAAFVVGYFDSIDEMHATYDLWKGATELDANRDGYRLLRSEE